MRHLNLIKPIERFRADRSGGVIVLFSLPMPLPMGASAAAIDYAGLVKRRSELQRAADSGSIAGVNPYKLANTTDLMSLGTAKAMAVPLPGRIVAVADVFDALTSERPYKQAWSRERARAYMAENSGMHFDPRVVGAFMSRWHQVEAGLPPARDIGEGTMAA